MSFQSKNCFVSGFCSHLVVLFVVLFTLESCSKKEDPKTEDPTPTPNGMAPGECRLTLMDDTATITWDAQNRVSKIGYFTYTYLPNMVRLSDPTHYKKTYDFKLDAKGYPVNVGLWIPGDTVASELTWFNYNADSTLALSRNFVWQKDHYVYEAKTVYTWVNKNLTRVIVYGNDSTRGDLVVNLAYDINKLDNRMPSYSKLYAYVPFYTADFMPKSLSKNLLSEMQIIPTGSAPQYYTLGYMFDAKGKITYESISIKDGQQLSDVMYRYECND
jgi:hypothetical protein